MKDFRSRIQNKIRDRISQARMFNSYIRGWTNYYCRFCPSALQPTLWSIERYLA
ncbi:group II intron maturase-specific domain-containing protein [Roseibium aggregatum]|uniref:group II intron maturase-specific domain-containing protein n=1 Tax=Roseibium aggregatum TaxID=187304 RepID=UPI0011A66E49